MNMKCLGTVVVYELDGGLVTVCTREDSNFHEKRLEKCRVYEELGAKLISCVITNNEEIFYKSRLQARLMELRDTVAKNVEWLSYLENNNSSQEVIDQTKRIIEQVENSLIKSVAIRCGALIHRDIPITDELALACYDYRQKQLKQV